MTFSISALVFLLLSLSSQLSVAADVTPNDTATTNTASGMFSNFNFRGYVHQGFVKTTAVNIGGNSNKGSFKHRDIGIYGDYSLNDYVDFRGFFKHAELGDRLKDNYPNFSYLVADVHKTLDNSRIFGVRVGKVRNELGFNNGVRENPVMRDQDIAPQAIYRDTLKELINAGIGSQAYFYSDAIPYINLNLEYATVKADMSPVKDVQSAWFPLPVSGHFTTAATGLIFNIGLTTKDLRWKFRYDRFDVKAPYERGFTDPFPSGGMDVLVELWGIRKYFDNFDITYEYIKDTPTGDLWDFLSLGVSGDTGAYAYAHNLVVRFTPDEKWTYLVGYNMWCSRNLDCKGVRSSAATGGIVPPYNFYFNDFNIAVKYKLDKHWTFKAEHHWQNGSIPVSPIDNPTLPFIQEKNKVFSVSATYAF